MDCINQCLGKNIIKCTTPFSKHLILWRNDSAYESFQDLKVCQHSWVKAEWDERERVRIHCESECRPDCVNRYYNKLMRKFDEVLPINITDIELGRNNLHDQVTQHIPEMSFTNFSGTLGGLIGVWLGFSIATAISEFMDIIHRKYLKNFNMPF